MASQGLLTLTRDGKVVAKITAGCDGEKVRALAAAIRKAPTENLEELHRMALAADLGCENCLAVVGPEGTFFTSDGETPDPLYFSTFDRPRFNPRWESGEVEHFRLVKLPPRKKPR